MKGEHGADTLLTKSDDGKHGGVSKYETGRLAPGDFMKRSEEETIQKDKEAAAALMTNSSYVT